MCGLVGFYPKKNKKANIKSILNMWVLNEERGTDSCGITIGPERLVGTGLYSKARDFIIENKKQLLDYDLTNLPIICHTRKSTMGTHIASNAHPFKWYLIENKDDYFAFAHNGVIRELEEFKKEFQMENYPEDMLKIDSQYLGLALYKAEKKTLKYEDILEFYKGNAAFLNYTSSNTFKAWKGGNNNIEERPLYYVETPSGWYFCSIKEALQLEFNQPVIEVENNQLLIFADNSLKEQKIILRSHVSQNTNINTIGYHNNIYTNNYWDKYYNTTNKSKSILKNEKKISNSSSKIKKAVSAITNGIFLLERNFLKSGDNLLSEINSSNRLSLIRDGLYRGFYRIGGEMANGTVFFETDNKNKFYKPIKSNSIDGLPITFYMGVPVKNPSAYIRLLKKYKTLKKNDPNIYSIFSLLKQEVSDIIYDYLPFYDEDNDLDMIIYRTSWKSRGLFYISKESLATVKLPSIFNLNIVVSSKLQKFQLIEDAKN